MNNSQYSHLEEYKIGDNSLRKFSITKNLILYGVPGSDNEYDTIQIGLIKNEDCVCSTIDYLNFNIRDTFFCDGCFVLHQLHCSKQGAEELVLNDYWPTEGKYSLCLGCNPHRYEPIRISFPKKSKKDQW